MQFSVPVESHVAPPDGQGEQNLPGSGLAVSRLDHAFRQKRRPEVVVQNLLQLLQCHRTSPFNRMPNNGIHAIARKLAQHDAGRWPS